MQQQYQQYRDVTETDRLQRERLIDEIKDFLAAGARGEEGDLGSLHEFLHRLEEAGREEALPTLSALKIVPPASFPRFDEGLSTAC